MSDINRRLDRLLREAEPTGEKKQSDTDIFSDTRPRRTPVPYIQPANEPQEEFKVAPEREELVDGRRIQTGGALPRPAWPRPGEIATEAELDAMDREITLGVDANVALGRVIWHYRLLANAQRGDPFSADTAGDAWHLQLLEGDLGFLRGALAAKNIPFPSESDFEQWAQETQK